MTDHDHREIAAELLDLVQQMEQTLKEYGRLLTVHDDGHWLEQNNEEA